MEQINHSLDMLDLILQPAFCVENGAVVRVNQAAQQRQIEPGTAVTSLLMTGQEEYAEYTGGSLYLAISAADKQYGASVTRMSGFDVFLLEQETEKAELHAMSLAAQQLREPLAGIMTAADRLFPKLSESELAQIAQINQGLFQMLRLISNMSDASRYTKSKTPVMETCNISALFDELFASAAELVSQAKHTLHFNGLGQDIYCLANKEQLERAVYNLVSNAIKFSPEGSQVSAKLTRRKNRLYLTVEDNGEGIAANMRGNVFSGFLREPGIADGRYGLGLGMVLVRAAAYAHGGTVLVEQPEKGGTRVTVTVALRQKESGVFSSNILTVDYAGERDHGLIELSDLLPTSAYENIN